MGTRGLPVLRVAGAGGGGAGSILAPAAGAASLGGTFSCSADGNRTVCLPKPLVPKPGYGSSLQGELTRRELSVSFQPALIWQPGSGLILSTPVCRASAIAFKRPRPILSFCSIRSGRTTSESFTGLPPFWRRSCIIIFLSLVFSSVNHVFSPRSQRYPSHCSRNPVPFLTCRAASP